jgi:hypothetical protein
VEDNITIDKPEVIAMCEDLAKLLGVPLEDAIDAAVSAKLLKLRESADFEEASSDGSFDGSLD